MESQSQPPDNLIIQRSRPISGHFLWEDWLAGDTVQLCPAGSLALANPGFPIHPDIGTLAHCKGILRYVFYCWHSFIPSQILEPLHIYPDMRTLCPPKSQAQRQTQIAGAITWWRASQALPLCISASDSFIFCMLARPRVRAAHTAQSKELQLLVLLKCCDIVNILKSIIGCFVMVLEYYTT